MWCLSGHIDVGRHLGLALKAPPFIVETGHVNLTSDHVTVGAAGPWTHDVKTGSSLLLRTQSTPGGEWLTLLWFCHCRHGSMSASMVRFATMYWHIWEKLQKIYWHLGFSCTKIYLVCWKKFMNAKYTVSGKKITLYFCLLLCQRQTNIQKNCFADRLSRKFLPKW